MLKRNQTGAVIAEDGADAGIAERIELPGFLADLASGDVAGGVAATAVAVAEDDDVRLPPPGDDGDVFGVIGRDAPPDDGTDDGTGDGTAIGGDLPPDLPPDGDPPDDHAGGDAPPSVAAREPRLPDAVLSGGMRDDTLESGEGNTALDGRDGNDAIFGGSGDDSLAGGGGDDVLVGGAGSDRYVLDAGFGHDCIVNADRSDGRLDMVEFGAGIRPDEFALTRSGDDLLMTRGDSGDVLMLQGYFRNRYYAIDGVRFADGTVWNDADIKAMTVTLGTPDADLLVGFDDTANTLQGGGGDDRLVGGAQDDTLAGGAGDDTLIGGAGNDSYLLSPGDGADTIIDSDATTDNVDVASFGADIAVDQLWFQQVGDDLEVSVIGTDDMFTIQNWYLDATHHIEQFRTADNHLLLDNQVDVLVQAMAAFAPPAAGQTTLPADYQDALAAVIAANWQ